MVEPQVAEEGFVLYITGWSAPDGRLADTCKNVLSYGAVPQDYTLRHGDFGCPHPTGYG